MSLDHEALVIEQRHRDAYAQEVEDLGDPEYAARIRAGQRDSLTMVRAFAKFEASLATPSQTDTMERREAIARDELEALANLIERPPVDDVTLECSVAMSIAASIRTILAPAIPRAKEAPMTDTMERARELVEEFDAAAQTWGWEKDQGVGESVFTAAKRYEAAKSALLSAIATRSLPAREVSEERLPHTCDGIEQDAFEAWAEADRFDMQQHPLHWLFLNPETSAARKGWRAGLEHAVERIKAALATEVNADPRIEGMEVLIERAKFVADGLNSRIDMANRLGDPVPIFAGLAELVATLNRLSEKG